MQSKRKPTSLMTLLKGEGIRHIEQNGIWRYAVIDVAAALSETQSPEVFWRDLVSRNPAIQRHCEPGVFQPADGSTQTLDTVDLQGVLLLAQSTDSPRANTIKRFLAAAGRQLMEETQNPELLALRARKLYEKKGYSRRWVDKRLRGISGRHELTSEWARRGATDSEEYRSLTNELMRGSFGMDVEQYRRYKGLTGTNQHLRDHMTDLELALTSLGETTAVALHQARGSNGFEKLCSDAKDAGQIVAQTLHAIEERGGQPVIVPAHKDWTGRRRSLSGVP